VLRSLKAIRKESAVVAMVLGRPTPDPGLSPQVELPGGEAGGLLDLIGIGKALPSQSVATEQAPPALLQVQPAGCPGYRRYPFVQLLVVAFTPVTLIPEKQCFEERKTSRLQIDAEASCGRCLLCSATCLLRWRKRYITLERPAILNRCPM
jgi:hypothetical protein